MTDIGASRTVLASTGPEGSGLVRSLAEVPPRGRYASAAGTGGELWFVLGGRGRLELDGAPGPELVPDRGLWIPAGTACMLNCGGAGGLSLDIVELPAKTSGSGAANAGPAGIGAAVWLSRDLRDCPEETTGDRKFRVLFGPGRDCPVATQFVGEIPPGRAPDHSHPYDEVVLVLQGTGVAHVSGAQRELTAGTCVHLAPGLLHCLENTGSDTMRVLGVFHPADSPASKLPG